MFRKPRHSLILSLLVGAGMQVLCVVICTMIYAIVDMYYLDEGAILRFITTAFPWFGVVNGYTAARMFTFFHGSNWMTLACTTASFLPIFISGFLVLIDLCEWIETGRADSVPAREAGILALLWLFIHAPTAYCGSYLGFTRKPIEPPVKQNRMSRDYSATKSQTPWYEIPAIASFAGFIPTLVLVLQLWQIL